MENTKQQGRLVPIIMMILLFGMISFVTNLAAPMGVVLKKSIWGLQFFGHVGELRQLYCLCRHGNSCR